MTSDIKVEMLAFEDSESAAVVMRGSAMWAPVATASSWSQETDYSKAGAAAPVVVLDTSHCRNLTATRSCISSRKTLFPRRETKRKRQLQSRKTFALVISSLARIWLVATAVFLLAGFAACGYVSRSDKNLQVKVQKISVQLTDPTSPLMAYCRKGVQETLQSLLNFNESTFGLLQSSNSDNADTARKIVNDQNIRRLLANPLAASLIGGLIRSASSLMQMNSNYISVGSLFCNEASGLANVISPRLLCIFEDIVAALTACTDVAIHTRLGYHKLLEDSKKVTCSDDLVPTAAQYLDLWFPKTKSGTILHINDTLLIGPHDRWKLFVLIQAILKLQHHPHVVELGDVKVDVKVVRDVTESANQESLFGTTGGLIPHWETFAVWQLLPDLDLSDEDTRPLAALIVPSKPLQCQAILLLRGTMGTHEWIFNLDTTMVHLDSEGIKAHQGLVLVSDALWRPLLHSLSTIARINRCVSVDNSTGTELQSLGNVDLLRKSNLRILVAGFSLGGGVAHVLGLRLARFLSGASEGGRNSGTASPTAEEGKPQVSVVTLGAPNVFNDAARRSAMTSLKTVLSVVSNLDPVPRLPCSTDIYAGGLVGCRESMVSRSFAYHQSADDLYVTNPGILEFSVDPRMVDSIDNSAVLEPLSKKLNYPVAFQVGIAHVCSYVCFVADYCGDGKNLCEWCPLEMKKQKRP